MDDRPPPDAVPPGSRRARRVEEIFDAARALPEDDRVAYVESACGGEPELGREVLDLLSHSDPARAFFADLGRHVGSLREGMMEEAGSPAGEAATNPAANPLADRPDLPSGTEVGPYRIVERIGAGGMGTVYRARDPRLNRDVALKFLPPYLAADSPAGQRFLNEARAAAALDHPNICTVYEISETSVGRPFLAMALYRGETLRSRLDRGPLPIPAALDVVRAVARALAAAHARGIIHRDVKPGNVMLTQDGRVKLLDFGLARAMDATISRPGLLHGTVAYMAPEQVRGERVDGRVDLWALGVMLYEMLAGRRPFRGGGDRALFRAILDDEPPSLAELRPDIPEDLERIVQRLLRKDPADRHASADELLADLGGAVDTPRAGGTGATTTGPATTPRWRVASWTAVAAALVGFTALAAWAARRSASPRLDAQQLAVFPFGVVGAESSLGYLQQGLPELIATKLRSGTGPKAVDSGSLTAALPAGLDTTERMPTRAQAMAVARHLGAGRAVLGQVASLPGSVTLTASLYDVADERAETPISETGPVDSLPVLVDRLVGGLLSVEAGEGRRLASLTTDSLAALRQYLDGMAAFRHGRFDDAEASFLKAARIDTTFALAELMTWRAASRYRMEVPPVTFVDAWRHRDRLSARDREFVEALVGPDGPDEYAPTTVLLARLRELVRRQPDNPDAWIFLARVVFGAAGVTDLPDSTVLREQYRAYARAVALDSTLVPALEKLWGDAMTLGDTAAANQYAQRIFAQAPTGLSAESIRCFRAGLAHGGSAPPAVLARVDSVGPALAGRCLATLYDIGAFRYFPETAPLRDALADHIADRITEDPRLLGIPGLVLTVTEKDRGRPTRAAQLERARLRAGYYRDTLNYLVTRVREGLWWDGDPDAAARAAASIENRLAIHPPATPGTPAAQALCVLGEWQLAHGAVSRAGPVIRQLRMLAGPGRTFGEVASLFCARVLAAWRADQEGAESAIDTLTRLAANDAIRPLSGAQIRGEDLILSRLLERAGDLPAAYAVLRRDRYTLPVYYTDILRREGRLAALLGDTTTAINRYQLYLSLRTDPEPRLRPQREQVRQALAALER